MKVCLFLIFRKKKYIIDTICFNGFLRILIRQLARITKNYFLRIFIMKYYGFSKKVICKKRRRRQQNVKTKFGRRRRWQWRNLKGLHARWKIQNIRWCCSSPQYIYYYSKTSKVAFLEVTFKAALASQALPSYPCQSLSCQISKLILKFQVQENKFVHLLGISTLWLKVTFSYSSALGHLIPSWLVLVEIECTVHQACGACCSAQTAHRSV